MASPIQNIALVGANGNLGSVILHTLLQHSPAYTITVLQRASSSRPPPPHPVKTILVSDVWTTAELTAALAGQHAVIAAFPLRNVDEHLRLADAAAAAGSVRRFIPADYGSVDARSPRARALVPLFERKVIVRERLEALAAESQTGFSWTSLVTGHFFDWGLGSGFLNFWVEERRAVILGDGSQRSSASTLGRVAEAVVRVLERLEETRDRVLMVQSFCVSQRDVLAALERAAGGKEEWEVETVDVEGFIDKHKRLAEQGDKGSVEELVFALGVIEGNWEDKEDFAMGLLGLENEDLDEVVWRVLREIGLA
ncbi:hypothetical protein B0T22DRAFT_463806 [Podospora appendiculata]|uniref:NmrA-like domain-containing protein n=1 Tax=Podospora appendiculata TaxID=314037 RepID=A0AAE0XDD0_9PEZI|nr:hypothetical protein B0T22DRAFT_463806 [Podospora appendiculata]